MRKQPSQIAPILCSIVALAGRHSATQPIGPLSSLWTREISKFGYLDRTKDLAASSVGKKPNILPNGCTLPRIPRIPRTYFLGAYHAYHAYHAHISSGLTTHTTHITHIFPRGLPRIPRISRTYFLGAYHAYHAYHAHISSGLITHTTHITHIFPRAIYPANQQAPSLLATPGCGKTLPSEGDAFSYTLLRPSISDCKSVRLLAAEGARFAPLPPPKEDVFRWNVVR